MIDSLGFTLRRSQIRSACYIPRYYQPELAADLIKLRKTHLVIALGELIETGQVSVSSGHEIGKMAYGTGRIPFVRTSDVANLEIKTDAKQGVSAEVFEQYREKQDVQSGDLLFVRDGTYLIGAVAPVRDDDLPMLYQSHLLKFRVERGAQLDPYLLLASLLSPIVRRQVRAKQFTADIIDTIGNRYLELELPFPRDLDARSGVSEEMKEIIERRGEHKDTLRRLPLLCEGLIPSLAESVPDRLRREIEDVDRQLGFVMSSSSIRNKLFIPRYYDPQTQRRLTDLEVTHRLVSVEELVEKQLVELATGVEPGKMSYGTGEIPFVRTSDFANWELVTNPKQLVHRSTYEKFQHKADAKEDDIFLVRDGTYLVGTSCILTRHDLPLLFAGGLYRIRALEPELLDPYLLFVLLNTTIVRRQVKDKQFTRDIIDTIGKRVFELQLPIPRDRSLCAELAEKARRAVQARAYLREEARTLVAQVGSISEADTDPTLVAVL